MGHHPAHHGYAQPEPSKQHAAKHDKQMDAVDRSHAKRNHGEGAHQLNEGEMASLPGGSAMRAEGGRGVKGAGLTERKPNEMRSLKKVAGGRPDTAKGKNVE